MRDSTNSFGKTFAIVLLAHLAVATSLLFCGQGSAPAAAAGSAVIPLHEIQWLDPLMPVPMAVDTVLAEPAVSRAVEMASPMSSSSPAAQATVRPVPKKSVAARTTGPAAKTSVTKPVFAQAQPLRFEPAVVAEDSTASHAFVSPTTNSEAMSNARAPTSAAAEDALRRYHERIQRVMESHWQQPVHDSSSAVPVAKVALTVSREGVVSGIRLATSSGSAELDRSALAAAHAVPQIDPLPSVLNCDSYQLLIRFVLH